MLFSSTIFLFGFLPIVLAAYFALRGIALRNALLLSASLIFYAWGEMSYGAVLLTSIAANYFFGLWIAAGTGDRVGARRLALFSAIAFNLVLLGAFKYANFAIDTLQPLLGIVGAPAVDLDPVHLPIGISFFTFHALSYVIDVYRRDAEVQRNPFRLALYISLFPQLVAGPIVRYREIAADLGARSHSFSNVAQGAQRFTVGLGKKVLLANPLAVPADRIFALPPSELPAEVAWLGLVCFALQLYFDFSGYSDMAIGLGRMLGFDFPENFLYPYTSRSVREFWRRWHITLSSWFRDYLYISLGGSRHGAARTYRNLILVFFFCGLWHGASLNFVVWGLLHGALIVAERTAFSRWLERMPGVVGTAYTLFAVTLAWVFFRADDLGHALGFIEALFLLGDAQGSPHVLALFLDARVSLALALGVIGSTPWLRILGEHAAVRHAAGAFTALRFVAINVVLLLSAMALASGTHNPFIYFRF